ncbi:unnamed protein product [Leuciscus chuanchicus]
MLWPSPSSSSLALTANHKLQKFGNEGSRSHEHAHIAGRKSGKIKDGDKMMVGQGEEFDEEIVLLQRQTKGGAVILRVDGGHLCLEFNVLLKASYFLPTGRERPSACSDPPSVVQAHAACVAVSAGSVKTDDRDIEKTLDELSASSGFLGTSITEPEVGMKDAEDWNKGRGCDPEGGWRTPVFGV